MISENLPAASNRSESTLDTYRSASPTRTLDRGLDLSRINIEWLAYGLLFLISIAMHVGNLGYMAMSHDESVVSYSSWRFFMGRGDFTCAGTLPDAPANAPVYKSQTYCYDPVYHGPTQYVLQFVSFFLFGVSDASARLPMALAGIGLLPMCWLLRPLVGRRTALVSAVLITFSPSLLYFARYARHDGLMVLWTMFLVVGMFLWLQRGRTGDLVLAAVGLALAWATHELVFILGFIGVTFLLYRWLWEYRPRWFQIVSALGVGLGLLVSVATALSVPAGVVTPETVAPTYRFLQRILGPSMLIGGGALMALLMSFSWEPTPVVTNRFRTTWATRRNADPEQPKVWWGVLPAAFWWAIGSFLVVFGLLFSTFGAYPRGFLDGFYRGLEYWWLSQHEAQRGGQPWYYYLMLLPVYELLALLFTIGGIIGLVVGLIIKPRRARADQVEHSTAELTDAAANDLDDQNNLVTAETTTPESAETPRNRRLGRRRGSPRERIAQTYPVEETNHRNGTSVVASGIVPVASLFVPFTLYWGISSLLAYSWAGEKMPWLLIHTALPLTLYAAAVIAGLLKRIPWRKVQTNYGWAVPLLVITFVITIFVGAFFLSGAGDTLQETQTRTRAIPALVIAALSLFLLWTVSEGLGRGTVLRLSALTISAVLLMYGIRAISEVVYLYPDTPREPIIYTQTSPDIPVMVDVIRQTAINQSRNDRTKDDPTGGNSMKIVIDNELAWPMQWYLRDFRNIAWTQVAADTALQVDAPIILLGPAGLNDNLRNQIADTHIKSAEGVFNWWFPENGTVPDPRDPNKTVRAYKELTKDSPLQVLLWPFKPGNWPGLLKFMLYREIPHRIEGRELEMYMRADTAVGVVAAPATTIETRQLVATAKYGTGELNGPRGVALDAAGNTYIADSLNHRIAVYDSTGKLLRSFGTKGAGEGQFFEPSGVGFDDAGNLYIADTWNARIVKLDADGKFIKSWGTGRDDFGEGRRATDNKSDPTENQNNPLGFFGPRNVLVIGDRVYIADTGNKRVVVTDLEGNYVEQIGGAGAQAGQFNEPIGLSKDSQNRLFVGDTWNGRVQIFARDDQQRTIPQPVKTFTVRGWSANSYNNPYLAVAPDGRTFVGVPERAEIAVYDFDGKLSLRLKEPQITAPHGLAITNDGRAVVADETNQIIQFQLP